MCLEGKLWRGDGISQGTGQPVLPALGKEGSDGHGAGNVLAHPGSIRQHMAVPATMVPTHSGAGRQRQGGEKLLFSLIAVFPER